MPSKSKSEAQREAMRLLQEGNYSSVRVAQLVGKHPTTVQRWAKKLGHNLEYPHNRHKERTDLVDKDEILRLRAREHEGKHLFTLNEIAEMCDCSVSYVKKVLAQTKEQKQ